MRESELTPEVEAAIVAAIHDGMTLKSAAALAGFDESTLHKWMRRGRDETESDPRFGQFVQAVTRAREEVKRRAVSEIVRAVQPTKFGEIPDWRARAWWLQRAFPEEYADRVEVHVREQALDVLLGRLREGLDPDAFTRVLECLAEEEGEGATGEDQAH